VWQPRHPGDDTVRQAYKRLLSGIAVNRGHAAEVPGIEGLQQIKRLRTPHFTHDDAIRAVPERGTQEVRDGDWRNGAVPPKGARPFRASKRT